MGHLISEATEFLCRDNVDLYRESKDAGRYLHYKYVKHALYYIGEIAEMRSYVSS